jgi:hypothetical protein
MSNLLRLTPFMGRNKIELSIEERTQLNAIIDLLIPSDQDFPPPSSLQLVDKLLNHLKTKDECKVALMINEQCLHNALVELNSSAGGNFCQASPEKQQSLLHNLEHHDPAFFQSLWTLVNHCYYALLAHRLSYSMQQSL